MSAPFKLDVLAMIMMHFQDDRGCRGGNPPFLMPIFIFHDCQFCNKWLSSGCLKLEAAILTSKYDHKRARHFRTDLSLVAVVLHIFLIILMNY